MKKQDEGKNSLVQIGWVVAVIVGTVTAAFVGHGLEVWQGVLSGIFFGFLAGFLVMELTGGTK